MCNLKKSIIFFLIIFLTGISFADVKKDLNNRKKELNKLQTNISDKKAEKEKLVKEENKYKQELKNISKTISKNQKDMNSLKIKIKNVEKNLDTASNEYFQAYSERQKYIDGINEKCLDYVKKKSSSYFDYPLEMKIRSLVIQDDVLNYQDASDRSMKAKDKIDEFSKTKNDFISLKVKQQNILNKNMDIQKNKSKQLKDTSDKRAKAEKAIKDMDNSKKALEALVKKLQLASDKERDKTRALKEKNTKTRKNSLPWPVSGTVIEKYGKNKHPELDTVIVSNGIKIKTQNNSAVSAIEAGTVYYVGEFRGYGKMVILDHNGLFISIYTQLKDILVKKDQKVIRQEQLATVGSGKNAVLYLEIRQYNVPEDPLLWLEEKK